MRCAIYCRLSREDEDKVLESESIQNQKMMLIDYIKTQQWELIDIYCDEDYSGADRSRPEFNRLLRDAKEGRFEIILCKTQSRFTRDMELVERYLHGLFPLWGIRFIALADHVDTQLLGNKKARQINGLVNEWYLEDLSENIRMVFDHKRRQGDYIGGFPLYGYRLHPTQKGRLVIDPEAASVVQEIFRFALEGYGKQKIADMLNEKGIPNPSRYKQEHGSSYTNGSLRDTRGLWSRSTVGRILHNEMYLGTMVQGTRKKASYKSPKLINVPKENWFRVEGTHEAIIDSQTFQAVSAMHLRRSKSGGNGEPHPLAGLVYCHACGSKLHKNAYQYQGTHTSYLRCPNKACPLRLSNTVFPCSIRLDWLLSLLQQQLNHYLSSWYHPLDTRKATEKAQKQRLSLEKEYNSLKLQYEQRTNALEALYLDKVSGLISAEQFGFLSHALTRDILTVQERIKQLALRLSSPQGGMPSALAPQNALQDRMARPLLIALLSQVSVEGKNRKDSRQTIHVYWKF